MVNLLGTYDCMIDGKGRIIVPAPLKRQLLPYAEKQFVIKKGVYAHCLELYVMEEWERQSAKVDELDQFEEDNQIFTRFYYDGLKVVDFDSTGRILLAKEHIEYCGITKNVIMAAERKKIEIWDKALYEKAMAEISPNFATLTKKVMQAAKAPSI